MNAYSPTDVHSEPALTRMVATTAWTRIPLVNITLHSVL